MKDLIKDFTQVQTNLTNAINNFPINKREKKLFDKWNLKDIIAHLNNWMIHDINCLNALKEGREPYWEPNVDEFNKQGVNERKNKKWDEVYTEFNNLSRDLIKIYQTLPDNLWEIPIWRNKDENAKKFILEDINHWRNEHLGEIIHFALNDDDWISPNTKIRQSKIGGKGLFALKPIIKGDLVVVWGGDYVNSKRAKEEEKDGKLVMQWDTNLFSVEDRGEGSGYFVNHSCEPNLWMEGAYALTALRDIEKGEELTADYAIWEADENYISKWNCNCGSKNCRHTVTGKDWQLSELQKKYRNHFSPLINQRIVNKF